MANGEVESSGVRKMGRADFLPPLWRLKGAGEGKGEGVGAPEGFQGDPDTEPGSVRSQPCSPTPLSVMLFALCYTRASQFVHLQFFRIGPIYFFFFFRLSLFPSYSAFSAYNFTHIFAIYCLISASSFLCFQFYFGLSYTFYGKLDWVPAIWFVELLWLEFSIKVPKRKCFGFLSNFLYILNSVWGNP